MRSRAIQIAIALLAALIFCLNSFTLANSAAKPSAKPIPSPSPKWPPTGFFGKDGVYAQIPTGKVLLGVLSAKSALATEVRSCETFACGAVIVASEKACIWWEISSVVYGPKDLADLTKIKYGKLKTVGPPTKSRELKTILLISKEPLVKNVIVSDIKLICHRSAGEVPLIGNTYTMTDEHKAASD